MDWTHKKVKITDIRKVNKFYILTINDKKINAPLFVEHSIFESRLNSFYLRGFNYERFEGITSRGEVLDVEWNMILHQGFFYKLGKDGLSEKVEKDPEKYYISFLEIDGPLGTYVPVN